MPKRLLLICAIAMMPVTAFSQETAKDDVETLFKSTFAEACSWDEDLTPAAYFPTESWELTWQEEYSDTQSAGTLYQFFCSAGAYNVNFVYYFDDPFQGLLPVAFAVPQYDVQYENDDFEAAVEAIDVRGFTTQLIITNAEFDPQTQAIENNAKWRGIGDASSGGRWIFERGNFVLKFYDVDASYDGEINPERIVEYK